MAEYFKEPQNPLKKIDETTGDVTYVYPLTTDKQVIMSDGTRLNAFLENIEVDGNFVYLGTDDAEDTTSGATSLVDADTLGGYNASHFATQEDLTNIVNGTTKVAKATTADGATKATQDGSGNTITSTYATKSQLGTQVTYSLSGTTLTITTK